ncbi:transcription elongation factor GreA [Abditibacterium utsteinense]|uniref:Transcription elongation factor GreA n=1 Tax=Abditibacterium utsteinense TaxID=1960156 RepID=A0A2S8SSB6_9BACT|nr:transcription elongation factor GreA [Abditibacterium utsteinense]PQV63668.1 transcription elongation factor GreA [Abditibacterium utsteinense]
MSSLQAQFTREGYDKLKEQLEELKTQRAIVRDEVKEARELGDLKENAGYHAARESQGIIEARISSLEKRLDDAVIVEGNSFESVVLGVPVKVKNLENGKERFYSVVGSEEMEFTEFAASQESPIGQVLLGKKPGEIVEVQGPAGIVRFEILKIGADA